MKNISIIDTVKRYELLEKKRDKVQAELNTLLISISKHAKGIK